MVKMHTFEADLCDTCVYFLAYGTTGDASAGEPSREQREIDNAYGKRMDELLGVNATDFDSNDQDSSFSWSGCEGCGATGLNVYTGKLLYTGGYLP